ncbi:hypothetical protein AX17_004521 [Amanita inopinata Kibby_2008]|nr:hypothetical protein AX17_004521 [Amanita inopinata Kibby_2008]
MASETRGIYDWFHRTVTPLCGLDRHPSSKREGTKLSKCEPINGRKVNIVRQLTPDMIRQTKSITINPSGGVSEERLPPMQRLPDDHSQCDRKLDLQARLSSRSQATPQHKF